MPHKIVVTMCGEEQSDAPGLLPADERYTGWHIRVAAEMARPENIPFFILSGKYGLVAQKQGIPNHSHQLGWWDYLGPLVSLVARDLSLMRVREIDLYIKPDSLISWGPYFEVIEQAAQRVRAKLNTYEINYQ